MTLNLMDLDFLHQLTLVNLNDLIMKNINNISIRFSGLLTTLLTVLFIGLKLTNYIDWSWVWILSPLWISWGIYIIILLIMLLIYLIK